MTVRTKESTIIRIQELIRGYEDHGFDPKLKTFVIDSLPFSDVIEIYKMFRGKIQIAATVNSNEVPQGIEPYGLREEIRDVKYHP